METPSATPGFVPDTFAPIDVRAVPAPHTPALIVTVGLPRSGKSSWARGQQYPIVNPDAIRLELHGQRFLARAEPWVWATAHAMVGSLFRAGNPIVIFDATNVTRHRRKEWQSDAWTVFFKSFDTPKETCIARAHADGMPDLIPVIERMAAQAEPLGPADQLW